MLAKLGFSICCAAALIAGAQPATTQSTPVDLSTPAAAMRSMYRAVSSADASEIEAVFDTSTPQTRDLASAYSELIVAGRRLQDAIRDGFAEDANAKPASHPPVPVNATEMAQLDAAQIQIEGDTATIRYATSRPAVVLHKTDGQWRIDLALYAGGSSMPLAEQIEMNHSLAVAMTEAADEVSTGKYASAQEAESGVQQKIHAVIARELKTHPPTRPSTTAPASGPTTEPMPLP